MQCANEIVVNDGECGDTRCDHISCDTNKPKTCQIGKVAFCKKDADISGSLENIPDKLKELQRTFNDSTKCIWLADGNSPCFAWILQPNGYIYARPRYFGRDNLVSDGHAFCY